MELTLPPKYPKIVSLAKLGKNDTNSKYSEISNFLNLLGGLAVSSLVFLATTKTRKGEFDCDMYLESVVYKSYKM